MVRFIVILIGVLLVGCAVSLKKFDQVAPGMSLSEVKKLIGSPKEKEELVNGKRLIYKVYSPNEDYDFWELHFDENDILLGGHIFKREEGFNNMMNRKLRSADPATLQMISNQYNTPQNYDQHTSIEDAPPNQKRCGPKPMAGWGCKVVACVNGEWQKVCNKGTHTECGPKPPARYGCEYVCINRVWNSVCS